MSKLILLYRSAILAILLNSFIFSAHAYASECMALWIERNSLLDDAGYCFGSTLGQTVFDNADCHTKNPNITANVKQRIATIRSREKSLACSREKKRWKVSDVVAIYDLVQRAKSNHTRSAKSNQAVKPSLDTPKERSPKKASQPKPAILTKRSEQVPAPVAAEGLQKFTGVWVGEIQCRGGITNFHARLTFNSDFGLSRHATLVIRQKQQKQQHYTGSILYNFNIAPSSGKLVLQPKSWLNIPRNRAFERPIVLQISDDGRAITGDLSHQRRKVGCKTLIVQKTDQTPLDIRNSSHPINAGWTGELDCGNAFRRRSVKNSKFHVSMDLFTPEKGQYFAAMDTITEYGGGYLKASGQIFIGETSRKDDTVLNFVTHNRAKSFGNRKPPLRSFQFDTNSNQFSVDGKDCKFVKMKPTNSMVDFYTPTQAVSLTAPFYSAQSDRDKCELMIEWADRLSSEFQNTNIGSGRPENAWRKSLPLADDDFMKLFGLPFDQMSVEAINEIWRAESQCSRDPFTRDRTRNLGTILYQTRGSDGIPVSRYIVRTIRMLRNAAKIKSENVSLEQLGEIRAALSKHPERLWPSEYDAVKQAAVQAASKGCFTIEQAVSNADGDASTKTLDTCKTTPAAVIEDKPKQIAVETKTTTTSENDPDSVLIVPVLPVIEEKP